MTRRTTSLPEAGLPHRGERRESNLRGASDGRPGQWCVLTRPRTVDAPRSFGPCEIPGPEVTGRTERPEPAPTLRDLPWGGTPCDALPCPVASEDGGRR